MNMQSANWMQDWKSFWVQTYLLGYLAKEHLGKVPESDKNRLRLRQNMGLLPQMLPREKACK